jgi:hypothetical protein
MKVKVLHPIQDHYGNIIFPTDQIFPGKFKGGTVVFPKEHPFSDNPQPTTFGRPPESDDKLGKFRKAGYHASCYPEGDGLAFAPLNDQTHEQTEKDIREFLELEIA